MRLKYLLGGSGVHDCSPLPATQPALTPQYIITSVQSHGKLISSHQVPAIRSSLAEGHIGAK